MKRIAVVAGLFAFMSYGVLADQTGDCTQGEEFCESLETTNAPDNVPIECAKNGNIKYLTSQFIAFIGSKFSGRTKIVPPKIINPMLTIIPIIIPRITIPIFFNVCFI